MVAQRGTKDIGNNPRNLFPIPGEQPIKKQIARIKVLKGEELMNRWRSFKNEDGTQHYSDEQIREMIK